METQSKGDAEPLGVEEVLGELDELAATHENVCIGDVLDDFGPRSFGPFILIPPLIEITPVGAILGVPTFLALIVAITAVQLLLDRDHVWMPQFIQKRSVSGRRLHKVVGKLRGVAHWLDSKSHGRLEHLVEGIWVRVAAVVILLLCCTVTPLEPFPLASSIPMLAIATFGLALTVRDGALMLVALLVAGVVAGFGGYWLLAPVGG